MTVIGSLFVKSPPTAGFMGHLPVQLIAVAAAIAGAVQASPAHALGGGVTLSQSTPNGPTIVTVQGAQIITKAGNLNGLTANPFNLSFTLSGSPVPIFWTPVNGDFAYAYEGNSIYTALASDSSNILSGTFIPPNAGLSYLYVYRSGKIEFSIASAGPSSPSPNCYTGLQLINAIGPNCEPYLVNLTLNVQTGQFGNVPDSDPGTPLTSPSIGTLLSSFTGTYNATGSFASGTEAKATFSSRVPSPLPIFGASMAFGFSRRLRQRIARSKVSAHS